MRNNDHARLRAQNEKFAVELAKWQNENRILKTKVNSLMMMRLNLLNLRKDVSCQTEDLPCTPQKLAVIGRNSSTFVTPSPEIVSNIITPDNTALNPNFKITYSARYPLRESVTFTRTPQQNKPQSHDTSVDATDQQMSTSMMVDNFEEVNQSPPAILARSNRGSFESEENLNYWHSAAVGIAQDYFSPSKSRVSQVLSKRITQTTPAASPASASKIMRSPSSVQQEEAKRVSINDNDTVSSDLFTDERPSRRVRKPVTYKEPSLSAKVRKGFEFFKFET